MMKNRNSRKTSKKYLVITICLALALAIGTIVVFAHLSGKSGALKNTLVADVDPKPEVKETMIPADGPGYPIKKDVSVSVGDNDYTVYVRAAIVVTWAKDEFDEEGNVITHLVHPEAPVLGTDYTLDLNLAGGNIAPDQWRFAPDGFYYYTSPVSGIKGENETAVLINEATQIWDGEDPYPVRQDGYVLRVEIAAQTIQAIGTTDKKASENENGTYAEGTLAVVDAWDVETAIYTTLAGTASAVEGTGTGADVIDAKAKNGTVLIYKGNVSLSGNQNGADPIDDFPDDIWG